MREVFALSATDPNANMSPVVVSPQPGYLELSQEQTKRLIRTEPIEEHYEVEDQPFARGKYATVRRCRDRKTGRQYAAKFLRKRRRSTDLRPEILHEVAVLEACRETPRVVRLHEVFESTHEMVLLLELACGGELQMLLDKDEVPSERQVVRLMRQILDGLVYLHDINVAHLDIKPQNLVLTGQFPDCEVKLCDFGISRYLSQGVDVREILGTPDYVAPEVLNYEPISLATDMWSVGVLVYVLLTGCSPFGGDTKQETFCNIAQCRLDFPDDLFEDISEDAKDFMRKLMVKNPSNRLSAKECLQQPWFTREPCDLKSSTILSVESKPTKPRTPVPSKRPIPTSEECGENINTSTFIPKSKPHETPLKESSCSTPVSKPMEVNANKGLSVERRKSFMKNMESLVEKLEDKKEVDNGPNKNKVPTQEKLTEATELRLTKVDSFRSMTRASGMQTMPVSGFLRYNRNTHMDQPSTYHHNREVDRESVFKFRRVFIINDIEDHSPPPSINGSLSSDNSSISDSNSDTVSEMSIDSSSDRSSIISLDDSFDFPFGKGLGHSRHYSSCFNVWEASKNSRIPPRMFPRECNGSFARALSRFATQTEDVKEGAFIRQRKTLTVFNGGSPTTSTPNGKKCVGLELMRERNGNIVVIREVKAINGSRYPRCSEVKCESLQSRIRKLQVQNGLKTELSKDHYNIF
uniref:non-specific serine/threonine protein kinase n=1 Tax=Graphocephala atropunctata TaxID=36148 RepID=A0A1B6LEG9_9HEMI